MKALVLEDYNSFVYKDVPTPVPGPGEVLVRVRACAVCGSDVHGMDGSTGRRQPPVIMGHEAAGEITAVGAGVEGYAAGDRVTFDSTIFCNACAACAAGDINLCQNRQVLGVSCDEYRRNGAFAEYVAVPAYVLYPLPDAVSFVQAAMVEPLAVAYHAATRIPAPAGGAALVAGVGTIGLLTLQVLKSMGVKTLIAVDIDDARLEAASKSGAAHCVNSAGGGAQAQILSLTGGAGVDAAYDATGISDTANLCIHTTRLNGHIVLIGNLAKTIDFPLQWVVTRQQSLFGSCASAGEYDKCLELIAEGKVSVDEMISRVVPLEEGATWITRVYNREPGLYKIVLEP